MHTLQPDWILTPEGLRSDWAITVQSGTIVDVGPAERHREIHERAHGLLLVPGFVNAHSHAFQRAFRGHVQWKRTPEDDFWSWRQTMYSMANSLPPEGIFAVSRLAFLEMLEAGITEVGEFHYVHHQPDGTPYSNPNELAHQVIAAAVDVGIRICLLRVAYARSGFKQAPNPLQKRFINRTPEDVLQAVTLLREQNFGPLVRIGLAPHSVRAVPEHWLNVFAGFDGPIHMHVSEQPAENEQCESEYGLSPTALLAEKGLLHSLFTAVHMTHPKQGDAALFAQSGAQVCVCPTTELDLGDGFLPTSVKQSAKLCVGTDSHSQIDIMMECRALELHARALEGSRNVLAPVAEPNGLALRLLEAGTTSGRHALGGVGRGLEAGAPADITGIQLRKTGAMGVPPLQALVFVSNPDWVTDVWVHGERVVRQGLHSRRTQVIEAALPWLHRQQ